VSGRAFRCGHVAIVGRPNVGKSTLLNRLVGEKISITSRKAQTTRHRVTGIRTSADTQFIFVDTPGFQTAYRSRLNVRMNRAVTGSLADVDAAVLVIEAGRTQAADRAVIALLPRGARVIVALNKIDRMRDKDALLPQMADLAAAFPFAAIVPVSAEREQGLEQLLAAVRELLPKRRPRTRRTTSPTATSAFSRPSSSARRSFACSATRFPIRRPSSSTASSTTPTCGGSTQPYSSTATRTARSCSARAGRG